MAHTQKRDSSLALARALGFAALVLLSWCALAAQVQQMPVGANKPDLAVQYLGTASGGDGSERYRRVTTAMAQKAIADAADAGIGFFRVAITGFAPRKPGDRSDLALWQQDPQRYWSLIDQMMDDLDRAGLRLVPVLAWNSTQFPILANDAYRNF